MRIIRMIHAGSVSLALCLPMLALSGGCDSGSGGGASTAKESPQDAATRQKSIEDAYKSDPTQKKQQAATSKK